MRGMLSWNCMEWPIHYMHMFQIARFWGSLEVNEGHPWVGHLTSHLSGQIFIVVMLSLASIWYATCLYLSAFQFLRSVNGGHKLWPMIRGQTRSWTLKIWRIWVKIGGVEHLGRSCKIKTVASPPPGIKSAIPIGPFCLSWN